MRKKTLIPVPVYDTIGITTGFQLPELDFEPKGIIQADIVQDWYYNQKDNIVFNKIKELVLYVKKPSDEKESIPVLKIVFN